MTEHPAISLYVLSIVFAAFIAAGGIKGLMGVGLPTTAIAVMGAGLQLQEAIPILLGPALAANAWQMMHSGNPLPYLRRFWPLVLSTCLGLWLGTELLFGSDSPVFRVVLGLGVIAYVALGMFEFRPRIDPRHETVLAPVIGFGSGAVSGITGSLLLPIVIYLQALGLQKDEFIRTTGVLLLTVSAAWTWAIWLQGALTPRMLGLSAFALVPTGIGLMAGLWLRRRVSERQFRRIIYGFLFVLGLNLIRKGILG